jgi:hypothetical protein
MRLGPAVLGYSPPFRSQRSLRRRGPRGRGQRSQRRAIDRPPCPRLALALALTVGSHPWAVGSGQWAAGSGQWAVGSGQWAEAAGGATGS